MRCSRFLLCPLLAACAPAADSDVPPWAPLGGISRIEIGGETLHYAELLGRPRAEIERGLPSVTGQEPPWVSYGDDLKIRYDDGVATRMRARIPFEIDLDCSQGARWMGFSRPRAPIVTAGRCIWPGSPIRNRLEKGFGGELDVTTRWFVLWLAPPLA